MIVRRPEVDRREVLQQAEFCLREGLLGDNWSRRPSSRTPDRSPHPDMQINLMNAGVLQLLNPRRDLWQWAGDQLIVDLDLSEEHLPVGTRLAPGHGRVGGDRAAARRLQEVCRAFRSGSAPVREWG